MNRVNGAAALGFLLYLTTGVATAIPAVLGFGALGWGGSPEPVMLSFLGSLVLVSASVVRLTGPAHIAHKMAMGSCLGMYFFYLPITIHTVRAQLSDQRLELTVVRWTEGGTSLEIEDNGPRSRLRPDEVREIQASGVHGTLTVDTNHAMFGSGPLSHIVVMMQHTVTKPIDLPEPNATSILYIQLKEGWRKFPPDARTLRRAIHLTTIETGAYGTPQTLLVVEFANGMQQGFGVLFPKDNLSGAN